MSASTSNNAAYTSTPAPNARPSQPPQQRQGSGSAPSTPTAYQGNQDEIDAKRAQQVETRDKTLAEFMLMLDDYDPLVSPTGRVHGG